MIPSVNETHDPNLQSWIESANDGKTDFPIQNLPYCVFKHEGTKETPRVGVVIGDRILDLAACQRGGLFDGNEKNAGEACLSASLNALMALGPEDWSALRKRLSTLLRIDSRDYRSAKTILADSLLPINSAKLYVPAEIGDYTDFYASIYHATNVGKMFRPDQPLLPNYKYVPIGYHGRSSSIVVSGTEIQRPCGQTKAADEAAPTF